MLAEVNQELEQGFFDSIATCFQDRFGPLSVRYDPDHKNDTTAQALRISCYNLPVFWRIDLHITSSRPCPQKWPHPFPKWSLARSAFWNVVWAVKHGKRGRPEVAAHYMFCACDKLGQLELKYSEANVLTVLSELREIEETDKALITKLREEMCQQLRAADVGKPYG